MLAYAPIIDAEGNRDYPNSGLRLYWKLTDSQTSPLSWQPFSRPLMARPARS